MRVAPKYEPELIAEARRLKEAGLFQYEISQKLDRSQAWVSRACNGRRQHGGAQTRYVYGTPAWWAFNNQRATQAMEEANIDYGPKQETVDKSVPDYIPPKWKTCPETDWVELFLEDLEKQERRFKLNDGKLVRLG